MSQESPSLNHRCYEVMVASLMPFLSVHILIVSFLSGALPKTARQSSMFVHYAATTTAARPDLIGSWGEQVYPWSVFTVHSEVQHEVLVHSSPQSHSSSVSTIPLPQYVWTCDKPEGSHITSDINQGRYRLQKLRHFPKARPLSPPTQTKHLALSFQSLHISS